MKIKFPLIALLTVVAFVGSAKAVDENGELRRHANNYLKIQQIHAPARARFAATIDDLNRHGRYPYIVGSYRNPATQANLKAKGYSKVSWSFHNAQTPAGGADALAMDVNELSPKTKDPKTGKDKPRRLGLPLDFRLMLASAAQSHRLHTGIRWGRSDAERRHIDALIAKRKWNGSYKSGWDAGHVQITGVTLGQAKRGVRPNGGRP